MTSRSGCPILLSATGATPVGGRGRQSLRRLDLLATTTLHYFQEGNEFKGRLEITRELEKIVMSAPADQNAQEETLWTEQWNKIMWGPQYELDLTDSKQATAAKANAQTTGKGMQLGKGKRHWSQAAIHSSYYEPYPFDLQFCVVRWYLLFLRRDGR